jgi:four helix bundle protein
MERSEIVKYEEWERDIASEIKQDSLWKMTAYRLALLASDIGWRDAIKLSRDRRMLGVSDQLYRALGSISANLAEGYSRGTGKDRARFYEYALGSARESRDWYFKARHILKDKVYQHRLHLLTRIIQLLLKMIPQQRGRILRERAATYQINPVDDSDLADLLHEIPLPEEPDV